MNDTLRIADLEVDTRIGTHDWEQKVDSTLLLDIEFHCDAASIALNDDLNEAVDYAAISAAVRELAAQRSRQLIETLAQELAVLLLQQFSLPWCKVSVRKRGAIERAGEVSISVERTR